MPKIWEHNRWYSLLRHYVDWCTRVSYRYLRYRGEELPHDGAVIIAPNHTNTLMDALVVLQTRKEPTVFGARADIFRKPLANKALRFLRILPMTRERDGLRSVTDNYQTFDEIDDTLAHNVPFCLFPEGRHTPGREVQPIQKGIARIAFRSAAQRPTVVVPTGINYTDFFRFRKACEVRYGKPLDVNAFVREHPEMNEAQLLLALRNTLEERMTAMVDPEGPAYEKPHPLLLLVWPFAALLSLPIWFTAALLCRRMKDKAWCKTIRYLCQLFLLPLTLILWGVLFGLLLPWYATLSLISATPAALSLFYDGLNLLSRK